MTATEIRGVRAARPLALVAVGGFGGAVARYALDAGLVGAFPVGTLLANVLGSFALGVLLYEARLSGVLGPETRLLVGTGFLSSFTTFSTFAVETVALGPTMGVVNVAASLCLGLLAVLAGRYVAGVVS